MIEGQCLRRGGGKWNTVAGEGSGFTSQDSIVPNDYKLVEVFYDD